MDSKHFFHLFFISFREVPKIEAPRPQNHGKCLGQFSFFRYFDRMASE